MALYKQGSHREEEHKEQGERKARGSHDGSESTKQKRPNRQQDLQASGFVCNDGEGVDLEFGFFFKM